MRFRPFLIDLTVLKISATEINRSPRVKAVCFNEVTILVIFFHNRALSRRVIRILHGPLLVYWKKIGFSGNDHWCLICIVIKMYAREMQD